MPHTKRRKIKVFLIRMAKKKGINILNCLEIKQGIGWDVCIISIIFKVYGWIRWIINML